MRRPRARADVAVDGVERVFGGNARRAYGRRARWTEPGGVTREEQLIMLSRLPGSQVQADPEREFAVLRALDGTAVPAPKAWALDADGAVTGASSILLQRMPGQADAVAYLRERDENQGRRLTEDLARAAAALHTADPSGLVGVLGRDVGGQVGYWRSVYLDARLEPLPVLAWLFGWLDDHVPEPARCAIVHGDLRPGNFLYSRDRLVALLDWEMVHLGDPTEDLAWIYRPLWSPERFLDLEGFVRCYESAGGPPVDRSALTYHRVLAEVKFAAISLRAASGFARGTTSNLRLADRAATVTSSLSRALDLVDRFAAGGDR
jgi:aminoglycoside phosphotransferase (APT) family kinase protein